MFLQPDAQNCVTFASRRQSSSPMAKHQSLSASRVNGDARHAMSHFSKSMEKAVKSVQRPRRPLVYSCYQ